MIKISFPFISTHRESDLKNRRSVANEIGIKTDLKIEKIFLCLLSLKERAIV